MEWEGVVKVQFINRHLKYFPPSSSPPSRRGSFGRVSEKLREVSEKLEVEAEAEGARAEVSEEPEKKEASLAVEETSEEEVDTEAVEMKAEAELVKDATEVAGTPVDGESEAKAVDIIDVAVVKDVIKAGDMKVDDEALGADWGLVIDRGGGEASTDGEPMEGVEEEEGVKEGGSDGSASEKLAVS